MAAWRPWRPLLSMKAPSVEASIVQNRRRANLRRCGEADLLSFSACVVRQTRHAPATRQSCSMQAAEADLFLAIAASGAP